MTQNVMCTTLLFDQKFTSKLNLLPFNFQGKHIDQDVAIQRLPKTHTKSVEYPSQTEMTQS